MVISIPHDGKPQPQLDAVRSSETTSIRKQEDKEKKEKGKITEFVIVKIGTIV